MGGKLFDADRLEVGRHERVIASLLALFPGQKAAVAVEHVQGAEYHLDARPGIMIPEGVQGQVFNQGYIGLEDDIAVIEARVQAVQGGDQGGKVVVIDCPEVRVQAAVALRIPAMQIDDAVRADRNQVFTNQTGAKIDNDIRGHFGKGVDNPIGIHPDCADIFQVPDPPADDAGAEPGSESEDAAPTGDGADEEEETPQ